MAGLEPARCRFFTEVVEGSLSRASPAIRVQVLQACPRKRRKGKFAALSPELFRRVMTEAGFEPAPARLEVEVTLPSASDDPGLRRMPSSLACVYLRMGSETGTGRKYDDHRIVY